jgi:hypothetical protein
MSNRYGLDTDYFKSWLKRIMRGNLENYKPSELARELHRMAVAADDNILSEPEFSKALCGTMFDELAATELKLKQAESERDALREKVEYKEKEVKYAFESLDLIRNHAQDYEEEIRRLMKDNQGLREELRKAREQEPVAVMGNNGYVLAKNQCGDDFDKFCKDNKPLYASPVAAMPVKNELLSSTFAMWWTMIEAEHELSEESIKDDQIILNYMGCGASCHVTAGDIRKLLSRN